MEKHWWFKNWQMDDFLPNSPMLAPSKVSLHMVLGVYKVGFYHPLRH